MRGFTLVETLVAMFILTLILAAIMNFGHDLFFINDVSSNSLLAQQEGRQVLRQMVAELRSIAPASGNGSYPLAVAATSSITFFSDLDDDSVPEQIRYFLAGTTLKRGVIKPAGNPLTYNPANEKLSTLVTSVANASGDAIFNYYDDGYAGTSTPLTLPVDVHLARLVKINVVIDANPNRPPAPITVTSQASLRNLKNNL